MKNENNLKIFGILKSIYEKNENILDDKEAPKINYIINRFLSFHLPNIKICNEINKHLFFVNNEIVMGEFFFTIPKQKIPFVQYIKKPELNEDDNFFWFKVKKYYCWSQRELEYNKQFILEELKNNPKFFIDLFGLDAKEIKKLNLTFERQKLDVKFQESLSHGLCDFS